MKPDPPLTYRDLAEQCLTLAAIIYQQAACCESLWLDWDLLSLERRPAP